MPVPSSSLLPAASVYPEAATPPIAGSFAQGTLNRTFNLGAALAAIDPWQRQRDAVAGGTELAQVAPVAFTISGATLVTGDLGVIKGITELGIAA